MTTASTVRGCSHYGSHCESGPVRLAIVPFYHTMSPFSLYTEDTLQTNVLEKCLFFCCPACQHIPTACTDATPTPQQISLRAMSWCWHAPRAPLTGDDVMHCYCCRGFHIKLYIPWALFSVYVHSGKRQKNPKKIVFLFTICKGSCDFIKGGGKHKGTVSSPQVFSGIFSSYTV